MMEDIFFGLLRKLMLEIGFQKKQEGYKDKESG